MSDLLMHSSAASHPAPQIQYKSRYNMGCDVFVKIFKRTECLSQPQPLSDVISPTGRVSSSACIPHYSSSSSSDLMSLDEVSSFMDAKMTEIDRIFQQENELDFSEGCSMCDEMHKRQCGPWFERTGRLGQEVVHFDASTSVGSLSMDLDRVSITSHSGFSSIKANVCVFAGKWQYEILLSTKGVMQIGWATKHCSFSQEKGVGDSPDSFAFDGSRVRKWNLNTDPYGETWFPGDVIGTTIDLDTGIIDFYRNGRHLGPAFDSVHIGPGYCYFPAVSMAYSESLIANFGSGPLRYPVPGFQPLQQTPLKAVAEADVLVNWLFNLIDVFAETEDGGSSIHCLTSTLIASLILERLTPLLRHKFVIESCLLRKLISLQDDQKIAHFLQICWTLLDQEDMQSVMEHVSSSLVNGYRFSPANLRISNSSEGNDAASVYTISPDLMSSSSPFAPASSSRAPHHCQHHQSYSSSSQQHHHSTRNNPLSVAKISFPSQKKYLNTFLSMIRHAKTRNFLLQSILFEKSKFPHLLDIKSVNEPDWLQREIFPDHVLPNARPDQNPVPGKVIKSLEIENAITEVEALQAMILDTLIFQDEVSRLMFITKFDLFLKDNCPHPLISQVRMSGAALNASPLPVVSSMFHRLVNLIRVQYQDMVSLMPIGFFIESSNGIPMDQSRIGGVMSHLSKIYDKEIRDRSNDQLNPLLKHVYILIHGLIKLYSSSAHKYLSKNCIIRDRLIEVSSSLQILSNMPPTGSSKHAEAILMEEMNQKMRQLGCLNSCSLTSSKLSDLMFLLRLLLNTLNHASESGLLSFIPDFYIESCLNLCQAVRCFFGFANLSQYPQFCPPLSSSDVQEYEITMKQFARFLSTHFNDERIASSDLKDSLSQALAALISQPETLKTVEEMPPADREKMIKSLLQPYENRTWAHSNSILLRIWKGDGFAYRHTIPSHMMTRLAASVMNNKEVITSLNCLKPCPSPVFQHHVGDFLNRNGREAQLFLSALLSQLNWSFSEFIGMLQEIQNAANKPEKVFIDSRQLKICFSCFDLSISLLRVLEMIAVLNPELLTRDSAASNSVATSTPSTSSCNDCQLLPSQLSSLLNQILNRVTSRTGSFEFVTSLDIPGLEAISHFPILSAVSGILIALILRGPHDSRDAAVKSLITDANFVPSNLLFVPIPPPAVKLITMTTTRRLSSASTSSCSSVCDDAAPPESTTTSQQKAIRMMDLNEMTAEEQDDLKDMVTVLHSAFISQEAAQSADESHIISDEDVCTICYANRKTATFVPCGHQSCRSCISMHFLRHEECFFCKGVLDYVRLQGSDGLLFPKSKS